MQAGAPGGAHLRLLRVLQLASGASPVGSFAWSDGLESAVEADVVSDVASARDWIGGLAAHGLGALDLPLLAHLHLALAAGQREKALELSAWLIACRETRELRARDRAQAGALIRVLDAVGALPDRELASDSRASHALVFALGASAMDLDTTDTQLAYGYAWLEGMVLAAIKLVPLGQSDGQRILFELGAALPELVCRAAPGETLDLDGIAPGTPGLAVFSAMHEQQTTRLYRS